MRKNTNLPNMILSYMNIIIPLCGSGSRFKDAGYMDPKPMINVLDKKIINYVLDNLHTNANDKIFIIYRYDLEEYNFHSYITTAYPRVSLIRINTTTSGAAETLAKGITIIKEYYEYNKKTLVIDCDTFYTSNIVKKFSCIEDNCIFYTIRCGETPIYSYVHLDSNNIVTKIAEKQKISDYSNTGAYGFRDIDELYNYASEVVENNIRFNNESYTSCIIHVMIKNGCRFVGIEIGLKNVVSLGTPTELNHYISTVHGFLFDLDGTIVITDEIYFKVWNSILSRYNIKLTPEIFQKYIQGNNDKYVMKTLLPGITIPNISDTKDTLFIEHIDKIMIVPGANTFIRSLYKNGHKLCIVTNCNRKVATAIIEYIKLNKYIDYIVASDDCVFGKPDPEPYIKAMSMIKLDNSRCIIFEDSKTGILSGSSALPMVVVGVETIYCKAELHKIGCNITIKDYISLTITDLISNPSLTIDILKNNINNSLTNSNHNVTKVLIDDKKLKGGFIADVISITIQKEEQLINYVLKYENKSTSDLSTMAKKLNLYEREYYFYSVISPYVKVKIPKFFIIVRDNKYDKIGIILENLVSKGCVINLDLGTQSIDISLKIIDRMAQLHSQFWNIPLKKVYPELYDSDVLCTFMKEFITERIQIFKNKWNNILTKEQLDLCDEILSDYDNLRKRMKDQNTTFIHGDIKSPNIFYDPQNGYEPYFIDWQHCAIGKGTQDLVFFILESFDKNLIHTLFPIFKNYYYIKLMEHGVKNYTYDSYEKDIVDSLRYVPFFTSIWFGSTPDDDLIDKNWPFFFIQKVFEFLK